VLVSPILKIDGPTPPMPSGLKPVQSVDRDSSALGVSEPWEIDDGLAARAEAGIGAPHEPGDIDQPHDIDQPGEIDEPDADAASAPEPTQSAADATAFVAPAADAPVERAHSAMQPGLDHQLTTRVVESSEADDASTVGDERPSPTPPLGTRRHDGTEADERLSPTPPLATRRSSKAAADEVHDDAGAHVAASDGDDHDLASEGPGGARLRTPSRWRWLLAALTVGVAGVSLYRTLYVSKAASTDSAASVIPVAAPPPPQTQQPAPTASPAVAPVAAEPAAALASAAAPAAPPPGAATAAKTLETPQQDAVRKTKTSPVPAATAKAKTPARKAAVAAGAGKAAAGDKASKAATKQSAKEAASGRRKLSAKPRKPPQKKERPGIIKKSPF
jgi:hypothetical protein